MSLFVCAQVVLRLSAKVSVPIVAHPWDDVVAVVDNAVHGGSDDLDCRVSVGHRMHAQLCCKDGHRQDVVLGHIVVLRGREKGGQTEENVGSNTSPALHSSPSPSGQLHNVAPSKSYVGCSAFVLPQPSEVESNICSSIKKKT